MNDHVCVFVEDRENCSTCARPRGSAQNMAFLAHSYGLAHTACWCARCEGEAKAGLSFLEQLTSFMHLCPDCGNKRCPRATYHENPCSASNDPGQPGSAY